MKIYLLRHTTPAVSLGQCYGQIDLPLSVVGQAEITPAVERLRTFTQSKQIYSSPLQRCAQLAEALDGRVSFDEQLMELNFGEWEGKAWQNLKDERYHHWMEDIVNRKPPNGESLQDLYDRVKAFWERLPKEGQGEIVVVAHSGVIRCFLKMALHFPLAHLYRLPLHYGGLTILEYQPESATFEKIPLYDWRGDN